MSDLPPQLEPANPIQDPVHGRIWLTKLEVDLVNTPEFQRLRRIGQLAPADFVFPGATHNRFAHSLGATHVMGWILRQKTMQRYFCVEGLDDYVPLLRVAALLHDIGHLPFSHVGEVAWSHAHSGALETYRAQDGVTVFDLAATQARDPYHEFLSVQLIRRPRITEIINRHLSGTYGDGLNGAEAVARIVEGKDPNLLVRNLLSSDLDCDRLDYLLRDSLTSGLVYGRADLSYLIGSLVVGRQHGDPVLAIDERHGLLAGEHYLLARYYHYAQFISHKTITSAEITLIAGIIELVAQGTLPTRMELERVLAGDDIGTFLALTDGLVETKLAEARIEGRGTTELLEAADRLLDRRLMKAAGRHEDLEEKKRPGKPWQHKWDHLRDRHKKNDFAARHGIEPGYFVFSHTEQGLSGAEANLSPSAFASSRVERSVQKAAKVGKDGEEPKLLIDESSVLAHLSGRVWATRRIFAREPPDSYDSGNRSEQFRRLQAALEAERS